MYLERIVKKSYLPTNRLLLELIEKSRGRFKVSFSITGTLLEQLEQYFPEVIESFQKLIKTGSCELLSETYYHSLAFLYSRKEFENQVELHQKKIKELFNYTPATFRNTELIFNNEMAVAIERMGFKAVLAEGADYVLGWRSPNFVYSAKGAPNLKVFLRNYKLSDDISFRFSNQDWQEWPLTADKFASWVNNFNGSGQVINLFMDYETFGEHQWQETGIFNFLEHFPFKILEHPDNNFKTVSEAAQIYSPVGELDIPDIITWADTERDLSAWLGNKIQQTAASSLYNLESLVLKTEDEQLIDNWRKLQTADNFYYMCTKWFADGDVHKYFNPYESPYECFISFMNILQDLKLRLNVC